MRDVTQMSGLQPTRNAAEASCAAVVEDRRPALSLAPEPRAQIDTEPKLEPTTRALQHAVQVSLDLAREAGVLSADEYQTLCTQLGGPRPRAE